MKKVILAIAVIVGSISAAVADDLHIRLSPNPATSYVNVQFDEALTGSCTVEVYTVLGTRVMDQVYQMGDGTHSLQLSTASLPEGIYLVRVTHGNSSTVKRLKIQRE